MSAHFARKNQTTTSTAITLTVISYSLHVPLASRRQKEHVLKRAGMRLAKEMKRCSKKMSANTMKCVIIEDLATLEQESKDRGIPIIGREKGTWLCYKIQELNPKHILELGTANGYSGCILGSEGAQLTTVEINPIIAAEAKQNFKKFGIAARVVVDDGVEAVREMLVDKTLRESFDMIFIDFAKNLYDAVLDDCLRLVKVGGMIIADNITFEGCRDFKQRIFQHPRLNTTIINIKDGMSCSERLE